jgi:predicted phosphodiesterase
LRLIEANGVHIIQIVYIGIMKLAIISDTHHEFNSQCPVLLTQDVDLLVLAGDIDKASRVVDRAIEIANGHAKNVVLVHGNHEYYGNRLDKAKRQTNLALLSYYGDYEVQFGTYENPEIFFLDSAAVSVGDFLVLGATCWTDYNLDGNPHLAAFHAQQGLNDFRRIKVHDTKNGAYRRLLSSDILHEHNLASQYIWDVLWNREQVGLLDKTIVVTHHAPAAESIDEDYIGSPLNAAYANNWGNRLAYERGPRLWIHGHMHCPKDYTIGETQIVCNPYGYPGQLPGAAIRYMEV